MPLSPPASRTPMHTRTIECRGYQRDDGLWDIEATLVDTKAYGFDNKDRGHVPPGEPLHGMVMRLTVDDDLLIHDAEAATDYAPFFQCADIAPAYGKLKGMTIGPGFDKKVRALFAGAEGCTHLRELLRPMATAAYQTIFPARERKRQEAPATTPPPLLDTCFALRADGPVVKRDFPRFYTGPDADARQESE